MLKKIGVSLGLRALSVVFAIGLSILIGRQLGPKSLGDYNLASSIWFFAVMFGKWGLDTYSLQEENKSTKYIYTLLASIITSLLVTFVSVGLIFGYTRMFSGDSYFANLIMVFAFGITPFSILYVSSSVLKSSGQTILGNFLLEPLRFSFVFLGAYILLGLGFLSVSNLIWLTVSYSVLGLVWSLGFLPLPNSIGNLSFVERALKSRIKISSSFLIANSMSFLTTYSDILMLGWLSGTYEVGLYSVAARLSSLSPMVLAIFNSFLVPKIANLFREKRILEIQSIARKFTAIQSVLMVPFIAVCVVFPTELLSIWGSEFLAGKSVLILLSLAQYFNLLTGCVGYLLTVSGNEATVRNISILSAIVNLILNYAFIQLMGFSGAALATMISIILQNAIWSYQVKKKLKISIFPLTMRTMR